MGRGKEPDSCCHSAVPAVCICSLDLPSASPAMLSGASTRSTAHSSTRAHTAGAATAFPSTGGGRSATARAACSASPLALAATEPTRTRCLSPSVLPAAWMQHSCGDAPPPAPLFPAPSLVAPDASVAQLPCSIAMLSLLPVREEEAALCSPPSAPAVAVPDGKPVSALALEIPAHSDEERCDVSTGAVCRSVPVPISMTRSQTVPAYGRTGGTEQQTMLLSPTSCLASPPARQARLRDGDSRSPSVSFGNDASMLPNAMASFHSPPHVFPQEHTAHSSRRGSIAGDGTFTSNSLWNSPDRTVRRTKQARRQQAPEHTPHSSSPLSLFSSLSV